jgi:hypothetical protein
MAIVDLRQLLERRYLYLNTAPVIVPEDFAISIDIIV